LTCGALRRSETGDYQALPKQPPGNNHKITDSEKFRTFAAQQGDKTQAEMAALWPGQISARTISRALHKIGFTRKKRPMATLNASKRSDKPLENSWQQFLCRNGCTSMRQAWTTALEYGLAVE